MPRGKRLTHEERLEVINHDLHELETRRDNLQLKIDSLEATKFEIHETMKTNQANSVMDAINRSGKSVQDVLNMLTSS